MELGSKYVYLGNVDEDEEEVAVSSINGVILADGDSDDDDADDGETCLLDILDTAGQEEYSVQRDTYVHSASGFVIIYSITDKNSFIQAESIFNWLKRIKKVNPCAILVANKQDLSSEAKVTSLEGNDLARKLAIPFFETSAKVGTGVVEAITGLIKIIPRVSKDYKIVMLGGGAVGKSSIILRFVSDSFFENYDPTFEDSYHKMIKVQGLKPLSNDAIKALKSGETSSKRIGMKHYTVAEKRKVKEKKTDGNVVLIALKILEDKPHLVTGDPIKCASCLAVLTSTATLEIEGDTKKWTCEFCGHKNCGLEISENEIPKGDSFDYMLSPPTQSMTEENTSAEVVLNLKKGASQGVTIYCMDISGSMNEVCHVPESHVAWREERTHGAETVSRVTKLDCIKKAIQRLTEQVKLENPQKQVLLTVFGSDVFVKGGGSTERFPEFGNLHDKSFINLLDMGYKLSIDYPLVSIEESYQSIDVAVKNLTPSGSTALGPALSICAGYAREKPGSEIVLCTDGLPNSGIGKLERSRHGAEFYKTIGKYARSKNITINILAVGESSSDLQTVSAAAEISGGLTTRLNPVEILRQLRLISQNEIIATSVSVKFYLHPDFVFDEIDFGTNLSRLEKEIGNVRKESDISFRFKLKDPTKTVQPSSVPFQIQITYTRSKDGMTCLRVLTKSFKVTKDRKEMEENINVSVLGVTTMKATAKMAEAKKAKQAQYLMKNVKRMMHRGAKSEEQMEERHAFRSVAKGWDSMLTKQNKILSREVYDDSVYATIKQTYAAPSSKFAAAKKKVADAEQRKATSEAINLYYEYVDDL